MIASRSRSSNASNTASASEIGRFTYSAIVRPLIVTPRLSGRRRCPWQVAHAVSARYRSSSSCTAHDPSSKRRRRFGITPSKSRPNGSGSSALFFFAVFAVVARVAFWGASSSAVRAGGPNSSSSRCFLLSFANGVVAEIPQ